MGLEDETTEWLAQAFKDEVRYLAKIDPGSAKASLKLRWINELHLELQNRQRALGVIKKAPLQGRKHQKPAFLDRN